MKLNELSYSSLNFTLSPGNIALQLKRIHHRVKNAHVLDLISLI